MTPYYEEDGVVIYAADVRAALPQLAAESVDCCVTSPPYWGLRDYQTAVWEGGDAMCDHKKVSPGTVALSKSTLGPRQDGNNGQATNGHQQEGCKTSCGKCGARRVDAQIGLESTPEEYVATMVEVFREVRRVLKPEGTCFLNLGDSYAASGYSHHENTGGAQRSDGGRKKHNVVPSGLKPKDLCGIPWRVALALQADGWYLRSDIIWAKLAPMPESVKDRPTRSHEYIFLLTKSARYFYDAAAIAEPSVSDHGSGNGYKRDARLSYADANGARGSDEPWKPRARDNFRRDTKEADAPGQSMRQHRLNREDTFGTATRNARDVWTIPTQPFPDAHFAVFPEELARRCIAAGCRPGGVVMDPFSGAGTVALAANKNGCSFVGVELNRDYIEIAARRLVHRVLNFEESTT